MAFKIFHTLSVLHILLICISRYTVGEEIVNDALGEIGSQKSSSVIDSQDSILNRESRQIPQQYYSPRDFTRSPTLSDYPQVSMRPPPPTQQQQQPSFQYPQQSRLSNYQQQPRLQNYQQQPQVGNYQQIPQSNQFTQQPLRNQFTQQPGGNQYTQQPQANQYNAQPLRYPFQQQPQIPKYQQQAQATPTTQQQPRVPQYNQQGFRQPQQQQQPYQQSNPNQLSPVQQWNNRPQSTPFWNNLDQTKPQGNNVPQGVPYPNNVGQNYPQCGPTGCTNRQTAPQFNNAIRPQRPKDLNINGRPNLSQPQSQNYNPPFMNNAPRNMQQTPRYNPPFANNGGQNMGRWNNGYQNFPQANQRYYAPTNGQQQQQVSKNNPFSPNNYYGARNWPNGVQNNNNYRQPYQPFMQQQQPRTPNFRNSDSSTLRTLNDADRYIDPPRYNPSIPANNYFQYALVPYGSPPIYRNNKNQTYTKLQNLTATPGGDFPKPARNGSAKYKFALAPSDQTQTQQGLSQLSIPRTTPTNNNSSNQQSAPINSGPVNNGMQSQPVYFNNNTQMAQNNSTFVPQGAGAQSSQPVGQPQPTNNAEKLSQPEVSQPQPVNAGATAMPTPTPQPSGPPSFYTQEQVDAHYRRMQAHNETTKDKEFENDAKQRQWYLHRAQQILREHKKDDNMYPEDYPTITDLQASRDGQ